MSLETKAGQSAEQTQGSANPPDAPAVPIERVRPVVPEGGLWPQTAALAKYMVRTQVHTYAFSVAANVILSLFPFIVMMLTIARRVHISQNVVSDLTLTFIPASPANQTFIMRNMELLAHPHKGMQIYSAIMLLISCTGVFLPLEVALNGVWGVQKNRSYLYNQVVSLSIAFLIGALALGSIALTAGQRAILTAVFFGHTDNFVYRFVDPFVSNSVLNVLSAVTGILIFFLIYWLLPNRKVPARAVLPTAIVIGLLLHVSKYLYLLALPRLDFHSVYGPFEVSVGLMIWAFLSGLLLLAGAHFSATRFALSVARQEERQRLTQEGLEGAQENGANAKNA